MSRIKINNTTLITSIGNIEGLTPEEIIVVAKENIRRLDINNIAICNLLKNKSDNYDYRRLLYDKQTTENDIISNQNLIITIQHC
jgi:hypothetical protein